jgi:hypothetical protein
MVIGVIMMLTINFGSYLGLPPQIQVFEDIICRSYRQKNFNHTSRNATAILPLNDDICKSAPVQSELALVSGWKDTFEILPCTWFLFEMYFFQALKTQCSYRLGPAIWFVGR